MTGPNLSRRRFAQLLGGTIGLGVAGFGVREATSGASASGSWTIEDAEPITTDDGSLSAVTVSASHQVAWEGFDVPVVAVAYRDRIVVAPNNEAVEFTIYDNTDAPVLLENFSGNGDSNGWGGAGEYTTGPGLSGSVNVDIEWNVLADPDGGKYAHDGSSASPTGALSVETPGDIDQTPIEEPQDGATETTLIRYEKDVLLFRDVEDTPEVPDSGDAPAEVSTITSADGSTTLTNADMDGFDPISEATATFAVEVTNRAASPNPSEGGSSDAKA